VMMKMVIPRTRSKPNSMNPMICAMLGHDSHSATLKRNEKEWKRQR
jgi:hypothetical protein